MTRTRARRPRRHRHQRRIRRPRPRLPLQRRKKTAIAVSRGQGPANGARGRATTGQASSRPGRDRSHPLAVLRRRLTFSSVPQLPPPVRQPSRWPSYADAGAKRRRTVRWRPPRAAFHMDAAFRTPVAPCPLRPSCLFRSFDKANSHLQSLRKEPCCDERSQSARGARLFRCRRPMGLSHSPHSRSRRTIRIRSPRSTAPSFRDARERRTPTVESLMPIWYAISLLDAPVPARLAASRSRGDSAANVFPGAAEIRRSST
jgi:hypothetical protein